ncbi:gluconate 2-dehydrogenase subunit 3 family protein [Marinobacterium rhizophilum]|uniref:gluconate 2-dehydrogenase subunit 3 family protein n=1 Tax=Marinobacterium rhizophilum TaxID=420402 RepID=UPI0009FD1877|nr:gluconate 2-dehydrogenase subunit 3 family protein [Marinobacterium rhizophilum]
MDNNKQLPSATRRLFLQRSLMAMAAVAASPLMSAQELANAAIATPKLNILTADDYRILSVVSDTIIPRGGAFPLGALDIDLAARIDSYIEPEDTALIQGVRGALMFLEHKAPAIQGKEGLFSSMAAEEREALLLALRDAGGDAVAVYTALRGLCLFYFYTDEQAWPNIGYDGPLVKRDRPVYPQVEG